MSSLRGSVDTSQMRAMLGKSSQLDPKLKASLRKRLRAVGQLSVKDIQVEVEKPPLHQSGHPQHRGLRQGIAAGVKVQIMTGKKTGVQIVSSGSALPAEQKRLVRAYDKPKGWRHPVFADKDTWVSQTGRPYFATIVPKRRAEQIAAGRAILADGAAALR